VKKKMRVTFTKLTFLSKYKKDNENGDRLG